MTTESIYAEPRVVSDLSECDFYHTMDIPGYGHVEGEFDLRGNERKYLGEVDFKGKRVLEVGTANGFLCFHMERQGAEVVAYDLNENYPWDIVPYAGFDYRGMIAERKAGLRRVNNGWWLCHGAFNSRAKVVYGTVYDIPRGIGQIDVATFCAVLPHFQNPFAALQSALSLTKETVVVTDIVWTRFLPYVVSPLPRPRAVFVPDYKSLQYPDSWWFLPPALVRNYLGVLGFRDTRTRYFFQKYHGRRRLAYSITGDRTA